MTPGPPASSPFPEMFPGPLGLADRPRARPTASGGSRPATSATSPPTGTAASTTRPAGGGAGMVLRADIAAAALDAAARRRPTWPVLYLSPRGAPLRPGAARGRSPPGAGRHAALRPLRGDRRAGARRRARSRRSSLGDFVLTGGEIAAMALIDACVRLIPRVLGNADSTEEESLLVRPLGVPALHPPDRMGRSADPRGSPLGASRTDRRMATRPGGEADQGTSSRPLAGLPGESRARTRQERQSSRTRTPPPRQAGKRRTTSDEPDR